MRAALGGHTKQTDNPENIELTVKVLDRGPLSGVDYTLTVTDTETGHAVTENESGLVYSGESGGLNTSIRGTSGHITQVVWKDTNLAAGGDPGDLTTDGATAADGSYLEVKLPDVLVSGYHTSTLPSDAGSDPIGPFFAYDASFRGGVDVPAASQGSGHAGQIDIASYNWTVETSAAEASGPMKESMETMKKAWKDASSTPQGGAQPEQTLLINEDKAGSRSPPTRRSIRPRGGSTGSTSSPAAATSATGSRTTAPAARPLPRAAAAAPARSRCTTSR